MYYRTYSHRNAEILFENDARYIELYNEVITAIESITDTELIEGFRIKRRVSTSTKSLAPVINEILRNRFEEKGWASESPIFNEPSYNRDTTWRLDFAKEEISIEVAFNHGEAIAWNLTKPVLASELNHVEKAIQTSAGIVICATDILKNFGNFDGSVGTYEKFIRYLIPMRNMLTSPLMLIGLENPHTFRIDHSTKEVIMLP